MAVGNSSAVVLRSRSNVKPANLLVQAQGFDARVAGAAATEAAALLDQASVAQDGDISSIMPGLPLTCGSVTVNQGRHRVLYRMVGQMIVMVVADAASNALSCLDLLDRCVRVVTLDFRSPEVSIDRFAKRYQEVYMALAVLLTNSGSITGGKALSEARAALDVLSHSGGQGRKKEASPDVSTGVHGEKLEGTVEGMGSQGGAFKSRRRTLASQAAQMPIQLGFPTYDGLINVKPLPGFEDTSATGGGVKVMPGTALHQLPVQPQPINDDMFGALPKGQDSALGSMLDELGNMLGPPVGGQKQQGPKKGEDPFAFIEEVIAPEKKAPTVPTLPPPATPPTPLLRLAETWRAEVRGANMIKAGHSGEVSCSPALASSGLPAVGFALSLPPGTAPDSPAGVVSALHNTRALSSVVRPGWPLGYVVAEGVSDAGGEVDLEGFSVDVLMARGLLTPVIMRYHIPQGPQAQPGWQPPVHVSLGVGIQPTPDGRSTAVILGVQLQLDARLPAESVASIEVRLHIPTLYELPSRVRPAGGVMDGGRRLLSWTVPGQHVQQQVSHSTSLVKGVTVESLRGAPFAFSAAFLVSCSMVAARGVLRTVLAEVDVRGCPGTTLSGVMLRQHGFVGQSSKAAADVCSWRASVSARLAV